MLDNLHYLVLKTTAFFMALWRGYARNPARVFIRLGKLTYHEAVPMGLGRVIISHVATLTE